MPAAYHTGSLSPVLKTFRSALADPNWRAAMEEEHHALLQNDTWDLVLAPLGPTLSLASGSSSTNSNPMVPLRGIRPAGYFAVSLSALECFVDRTLVYSASWTEHLQQLRAVLDTLRAHHLHVKRSKCSFAEQAVHYLEHVITATGVAMDTAKVSAVQAWPQPRSTRGLRGFLGLVGYYRRFIRNYGTIAAPLTQLLRKAGFQWTDAATAAFDELKAALAAAPVLHLPDFAQDFIVDYDASGSGFGAVLHQGEGPIAYFSRPFAARHLKSAAYERELIGLVQAVRHWRPYLWGRAFIVRTDHYAIKFLLDQRLSTIPQNHWVSKLFGYDFQVQYRQGRLNVVADALSRRDGDSPLLDSLITEPALAALSVPSFLMRRPWMQTYALDGMRSQRVSTALAGACATASSSTTAGCSSLLMRRPWTTFYSLHTPGRMKASRKLFSASGPIFSSSMIGGWSVTSFEPVPPASGIKPSSPPRRSPTAPAGPLQSLGGYFH